MTKFRADSSSSTETLGVTSLYSIPFGRHRLLPLSISALLAFLVLACSGGASDPVIVSENPAAQPTGTLTVAPASFLISEEETLNMTAKLGATTVGASQVTWSVSPSSVATIDKFGVLTALKHGEATVTARYSSLQGTSVGTVRAIPKTIQAMSSTGPVGIVARALSDSIGVQAVSKDGIPVPGVSVSFELPSGDGLLSHAVQTTGTDGTARVLWTLGTVAGPQQLRAHSGNLGELIIQGEALADYDSATVVPLAGDEQEAVVATFLPEPLRAQVTDQFGNPLPGLAIEWSFANGGGSNGPAGSAEAASSVVKATTDGEGMTLMNWKLGTQAGDQEALLELAGGADGSSGNMGGPQGGSGWVRNLWKRWKAKAKPAAPDAVQVTPEESWALVAEEKKLDATLIDAFGNEIEGGFFSWRTDNSGVVGVDGVGNIRGLKGGRAAVFAESVSPELSGSAWVNIAARVASSLRRQAGNGQTAPVGNPLPTPVSIQVLDQVGDPLEGAEVFWRVVEGPNAVGGNGPHAASASGEPTSPLTYTDENGVSETSWILGAQAGQQVLQAIVDTLPPIEFTAGAFPGPVASIALTPSEAEIGTGLIRVFSATAQDAFGNEIAGASFSWSSSDPAVAEVVGDGVVRGQGVGFAEISAAANGVTGSANLTVTAGEPATAEIAAGNGQDGTVGATLPVLPCVHVLDASGAPVPGATVSWAVTSGDGSISAATSLTAANGIAETSWTLGTAPGEQQLQASVGELPPVAFTADASPGAVTSIALSPSEAEISTGLIQEFSVTAQDAFGNAVAGASFSWSSSDPAVAEIVADGVVRGQGVGSAEIIATSDGVTGSASLTVKVGGPATAEIAAGNGQDGTVGATLPVPLRVGVFDASGAPVPGATVSWAVTSGGGSISAATSLTAANGIAETSWTLGTVPGGQQLLASVGELSPLAFTASATPGPVANLFVTPSTVTVMVGETSQLGAAAEDGYGNPVPNAVVTWTSSAPAIATSDANGLVLGMSEGVATITAEAGGVQATSNVTVEADPDPLADQLLKEDGDGQSGVVGAPVLQPLRVRMLDGEHNPLQGRVVDWQVVMGGGSITPTSGATDSQGYSEATWTLGTRPGGNGASASVEGLGSVVFGATAVAGPVAVVSVTPASASIEIGQDQQFSAAAEDEYGNELAGVTFTWSSSDPGVATVDGSGVATGVGEGTAQVRASAGGVTGEAQLTVTALPPAGNPGTVTDLNVAGVTETTVTLRWTEVDDGTGNPAKYAIRYGPPAITWGAAYPTEVSVSGTGIGASRDYTWTGLQSGTAYQFRLVSYRGTLNAGAEFGGLSNIVSDSTASGTQDVASLTVSPSSVSMTALEQTVQLTATARDASSQTVSGVSIQWTSLNTSIATVDQEGRVTSKAVGQALIVVTALCCQVSDTVAVNIAQVPAQVVVSPASFGLQVGGTRQLTASVKDQNGFTIPGAGVTWSSTNASVATVSGSGLVMAQGSGSATIRAESGSASGQAVVSVSITPPASGDPFFSDDFASGDLTKTEGGFAWNTGVGRVTVATDNPRTGSYSMAFRYGPNADGEDSMAEKRFSHPQLQEYWMEYYIYFPDGTEGWSAAYTHRSQESTENNKFMCFWPASYSGAGSKPSGCFQLWRTGTGFSNIDICRTEGDQENYYCRYPDQHRAFLEDASDLGRWIKIRIHIRCADTDTYNGIIQLWKDDVLIIDVQNDELWDNDNEVPINKLWHGYLMGWSNSGFTDETYIHIDDFKMYSSDPRWE